MLNVIFSHCPLLQQNTEYVSLCPQKSHNPIETHPYFSEVLKSSFPKTNIFFFFFSHAPEGLFSTHYYSNLFEFCVQLEWFSLLVLCKDNHN